MQIRAFFGFLRPWCNNTCLMLMLMLQFQGLGAQPAREGLEVTSVFGLPIAFYTPETRWGGGAAGLLGFRFRKDSAWARPSQIQLGFAYTQEKQFLSYLPFTIFADNNRWYWYGELGYYRYTYFFYGLGNADTNPSGELYDVTFPRLRVHGMRLVAPHLYVGAHYWADVFAISNVEPGGLLADSMRNITGRNGGIISAPGLMVLLDNREDVFAPERGYYLEGLFQVSGTWTGSPFSYTRLRIDGRYYLPVWPEQHHVLAMQAYGEFTSGDPPFNALALLGGTRLLRGYYEGRYRDRNFLLAQAEYRLPLFWRIGMTAFAGVGTVFSDWNELSGEYLRFAGGGGIRIRISNQDRVNVRLDAAFGPGTSGYYVTVGEAF